FRTYYQPAAPEDTTAPVIDYTLAPTSPDGSNGWYRNNVALTWSVTDPESTPTVTAGCEDQLIQSDQLETTYSCSATSAGGDASLTSVAIKRDNGAPEIVATIESGTPGLGDWFTSNVTIAFDCDDALSG